MGKQKGGISEDDESWLITKIKKAIFMPKNTHKYSIFGRSGGGIFKKRY